VKSFSYGLMLPGLGQMGEFATRVDIEPLRALPKRRARAIRLVPPMREWVNVRRLGVKGDDATDDTQALQRAIDRHRVLYLPSGRYRVTDTLKLRPDSVLIALHPSLTHIYLPDETPAFMGTGSPKAMIESAKGGAAILSGVGLWTGAINTRAMALLWKAGEDSLVEDVKIQGGGGTHLGPGSARIEYNNPKQRWDGQGPSIWVTDGGGGTFANIWSPNTFAQSGFYISDTKARGRVYQLSAEHHVRNEIVLDGVENWEFYAPQTEQEVRDGLDAFSMEIRNSRNLLFANYHGYRVTRSLKPAAAAVRLYNSGDIRFRNVHVNAESSFASCDYRGCGTYTRASKFPFENVIYDVTGRQEVREREFALLDIPPAGPPAAPSQPPPTPQRLETGFYSISGGAVDRKGRLYFVERHFHRIFRWSADKGLELIADTPLDPVNLAVDRSGNLLVLSMAGRDSSVYSLDPDRPQQVRVIEPTDVRPRPDARTALPINIWNNGEFRDQLNPQTYEFTTLAEMFARDIAKPKAKEYVSPDGSLVLPQFRVWNQGGLDHTGWRWSDSLDSYGFTTGRKGERVFITNGSENKTYSGVIADGGALTDLKAVANRGGESVAAGPDGRIYVANGQVWVYAADGSAAGRLDVPERPLQLLFGGEDGRTLFILTHHSLYAMTIPDVARN
jgi:hypothetical protein